MLIYHDLSRHFSLVPENNERVPGCAIHFLLLLNQTKISTDANTLVPDSLSLCFPHQHVTFLYLREHAHTVESAFIPSLWDPVNLQLRTKRRHNPCRKQVRVVDGLEKGGVRGDLWFNRICHCWVL